MKRSMKLVSARTSCWWGTSAPARRTWPRRCACWRASGGWRPASSPRHRSSCGCGAPATRGALTVRPRSSAALGCSSSTSSASCRWISRRARSSRCSPTLRAAVGGHHHEPGVQPVGRGVRRRPDGGGRAHRQGHGHVVLPLPVLPKNTRSSRGPTKPSESMSSRPQPSENRTCDQSNPSADLCTGSLACLSSRALLVASLCASSARAWPCSPPPASSILSTSIIPSCLCSLPIRRTDNVKACGLVGVAVLKTEKLSCSILKIGCDQTRNHDVNKHK